MRSSLTINLLSYLPWAFCQSLIHPMISPSTCTKIISFITEFQCIVLGLDLRGSVWCAPLNPHCTKLLEKSESTISPCWHCYQSSDIQNSVNSRPLTYRNDDMNFLPLTPNDFLKFDSSRNFIIDDVAGSEISLPNRKQLVQSLEKRAEIYQSVKDLWVEEYLLSLRESYRNIYQAEWEDRVKPNDIVLISNPSKPKILWQMGRVLRLLPGKDGITRCVRVIRPDRSEGVYSICHLYPLELDVSPSKEVVAPTTSSGGPPDTPKKRPPRRAAAECLDKLKRCY